MRSPQHLVEEGQLRRWIISTGDPSLFCVIEVRRINVMGHNAEMALILNAGQVEEWPITLLYDTSKVV